MIKLDTSHLGRDIDFASYEQKVAEINQAIDQRTMPGNDFLGWTDWPDRYDREELSRIQKAAEYIRENYRVLVVCGIGGSYLGARAAIEALKGLWVEEPVKIIYFGQTVDPNYCAQVLKWLRNRRFAINVISKSGTTTETAVGFRLLRDLLVEQVGLEGARKAIFVTTDKEKGALLELSKKYGYERFVLPDDIGGRFSVITAVGTLPMAVAGIDVKEFLAGASDARKEYDTDEMNDCYRYAVIRHALYREGFASEMLISYQPRLVQFGEWWKQLFGESEGKNRTGLLPSSATFTTDLHSLGQFIQQGAPVLFETVLNVIHPNFDLAMPHDEDNLDKLNYLEGKSLDFICKKAMEGTIAAHTEDAGLPNVVIDIDQMDARHLGHLMYFFFRACAMSAYLNGVNPFNQPGVEIYKKNMFHLLGKPGY